MAGMILVSACTRHSGDEFTRRMSFDTGWKFHYGVVENISNPDLDPTTWQDIDLPHDWSITLPFSQESAGGTATGYTVGGTGWYVKKFFLQKEQSGERLALYFEGAYMETEVWMNGRKLIFHPYGYTPFFCDITTSCNPPGQENILAVKVSNNGKNSRWYSGSGIYRHVWLETTDKLCLDTRGIYITTPVVESRKAVVRISADIMNSSDATRRADVFFKLFREEREYEDNQSVTVSLEPGERKTIVQQFEIQDPDLWSVESPALYLADISLKSRKELRDRISTTFGIRSLSFSAEHGFLLNDTPLELKGGCLHHDNGLLGAAAIDRAEERKVELLKANGFNAVRCAHNPPSEKFLEACDRLGLLVIDEAFDHWQQPKNPDDYHRFFDEWNEKDFTAMLMRDRNHPSVIMWSIGNEIQERADTSGLRIIKNFRRLVEEYDPTRPVTLAVNDFWDKPNYTWKDSERVFEQLDVGGYNYLWWLCESDHQQFPGRIIYQSESTPMERAINWDLVENHPYIIGDFVWTAMDYLGETGIGHFSYVEQLVKGPHELLPWPCFNAWCGDIDICGDKKPQSALRDILWGQSRIEILVHAPAPDGLFEKVSYWGWPDELATWNWKGSEGEMMDVRVFTRYPSVRLYLNGRFLEEKGTSKDAPDRYTALFRVRYEPGILKAVGIENGMEKETTALVTTGEPVKVSLKADRMILQNSRNELSYVRIELVDKDGLLVRDDDRRVELSVSGAGEIAAAGNASPVDMESFRSMSPKTFRGRALAIVRPTGQEGTVSIKVRSAGLPEETIRIEVGNVSLKTSPPAPPLRPRESEDQGRGAGVGSIIPGAIWRDSQGNTINAHGGGILYHQGIYYWYGEYKGDSTYRLERVTTWECWRADAGGVSCYSSPDLVNWTFEGLALPATPDDDSSELHPSQVIERPKVIHNDKTGKFVMWMHIESPDYEKAHAGVAVSDSPAGPFTYLGSFKPNEQDSRDQTLFRDDDGRAYHICSSEWNKTLYISLLNDDYTKPSGIFTRNFIGESREAPAVFKHDGKYYMITSGCTGWDPNVALIAVADSMLGMWTMTSNPCKGTEAEITFRSQSTFILPVNGKNISYIAMFDRWNKTNLADSRYVWLPLVFENGNPVIEWRDQWTLD